MKVLAQALDARELPAGALHQRVPVAVGLAGIPSAYRESPATVRAARRFARQAWFPRASRVPLATLLKRTWRSYLRGTA